MIELDTQIIPTARAMSFLFLWAFLAFRVRKEFYVTQDPEEGAHLSAGVRRPRPAPPRAQLIRSVAQREENAFDAGLHEPSGVQECRIVPVKLFNQPLQIHLDLAFDAVGYIAGVATSLGVLVIVVEFAKRD